jgi:hypothetical protein
MQQGHAAWTCIQLLWPLAFLSAEWIWALEPGFQCGAAKGGKKREFALFFFCAQRFLFDRARFSSRSRALFMLRAREHESAKKRGCPTLNLID